MRAPNNKRSRGRPNRRSPNPNRSYESNGPDGKIRGNANQVYDKYSQLARDAAASGDPIAAEGYWQHAEHYYRIMMSMQQQRPQQQQQNQADENDQADAQPPQQNAAPERQPDPSEQDQPAIAEAEQPESDDKPREDGDASGVERMMRRSRPRKPRKPRDEDAPASTDSPAPDAERESAAAD